MRTLFEIFSDYNPRNASNGEIRMGCPFSENHTGSADGSKSFFVNQDKNVYNCFSCKAAGSLLTLLTVRFHVPLSDAFELVTIDNLEEKISGDYGNDNEPLKVYQPEEILTWDKPPKYYLRRKYDKEVLKHFRIGEYKNANGDTVISIPVYKNTEDKDFLLAVQHTIKDDVKGRSFWFKPTGFPRHRVIYNEHNQSTATLVEGPSDVWKCFQSDRPDAVGTFGTMLTANQIEILKKYKVIRLAYDNDLAGMLATEFAYHALKHHTKVLIVPYHTKDPGKATAKHWQNSYDNATDYAEYHWAMCVGAMGEEYDGVLKETKKRLHTLGIFV